jgi:hypothetical protein
MRTGNRYTIAKKLRAAFALRRADRPFVGCKFAPRRERYAGMRLAARED